MWLIPPRVLHSDTPKPARKTVHSAAADATACHCSFYRIKLSCPIEVETASNRDDPGLLGYDAVTDERINPQYKVCLLTGTRYMKKRWAMGAGSGAGTPRRKPVGFLVAVKLFYISLKKLPQFHFDPVIVWSLIAAKPSSISPCCEASGVPVPEYLPHRKATTGYT